MHHMEIAVLGWGSLIRCPGCLDLRSRWRRNGPLLPVEFARISSKNRLTLVLLPHRTHRSATLWALSARSTLDQARANLACRERTSVEEIHFVTATRRGGSSPTILVAVRDWLRNQPLDAAIWTGLGSTPKKWKERYGGPFSRERALQFLRDLRDRGQHEGARDYVRDAPAQVQTPLRVLIESNFGAEWQPAAEPTDLFETEP